MRAAVISTLTGPGDVRVRDVPIPEADADRVLVDVHHAAVAFPDVLQTRGEYQLRPELPFTPGWEVAGVVRENAHGLRAGARVAAMPVVGGFAEVVAVEQGMVFPLPDSVPTSRGAAPPLNYLTADFALGLRAQLRPGETVLVHGAAGGLGTATCQLAAARGARVLAVVSSDAKADVARAAGAHEVLPVDGFLEAAREMTAGAGVDVVVDPVGGDRFTDSLRSLAVGGRVVVLGFAGRTIPTVKVNRLLLTNTSVVGAASNEYWQSHPGHARRQWNELRPLVESGLLDPPIGGVHPLDDVAAALRQVDERRAAGRLIIQLPAGAPAGRAG